MLFGAQLALTFALIVGRVWCQILDENGQKIAEQVFGSSPDNNCGSGPCLAGLRPISSTTEASSMGYTPKCGEGPTKGKWLCVNYEFCNATSMTIVQNGLTSSFGQFNIRQGLNGCKHPLEKCCKIPDGGLSPGFNPASKPVTTTPRSTPDTMAASEGLVSSTSPSSVLNSCGVRNLNGIDFKITGNNDNEAEYGEFPWMVAIMKKQSNDGNSFFCGGSLLSATVVVTATHCIFNFIKDEIKIRAGEWDSQTAKERLPYQERNVVDVISHADYVSAGLFNDITLLVLDRPLKFDQHIGHVCLPEQDQVIDSQNCFVTGWGKDIFGDQGQFQQILKKIELPMVLKEQCQEDLRRTHLGSSFVLHDSFVCAGGKKGKDACTGDGGSPLVCPDPTNPNRYVLTGMVAWGIGCGDENVPGVYVNVAKFKSWIDQKLLGLISTRSQ